MKRQANFGIAQSQGQQMALDAAKKGVGRAKRVGAVMAKKGLKAVTKNPGKAGLALAGLAAAGGLGMAGAKAIGNARKPKTLGDRIKNASKKMFK
jgi:hypothetical protein